MNVVYLAGERADPDTIEWAQTQLNVPVIDHWWQTETGFAIAANPMGIEHMPVKLGSPSVPMPGYDVQVLDEGGHPMKAGELGAIAVKLPLAPRHVADALERGRAVLAKATSRTVPRLL